MAKSKTAVDAYNDEVEKIANKEKKIAEFAEILDGIKDLDTKKKVLWTEIYQNAVIDRDNASLLFTDTFIQVKGNAANHNILGPVVVKYLERMSRANDQILKLAELIAREDSKEMDTDSIFDKIGSFGDS
jgi:hypothetical protein